MNRSIKKALIEWLGHDHAKEYMDILDRAPTGPTEFHHILPRSLFPEFEKLKDNLVELSTYDHMEAHECLAKTLEPKMIYAFNFMFADDYRRYSKLHIDKKEILKQKKIKARANMAKIQSEKGKLRVGKLNTFFGKTHSEETKTTLSKVHKGKKLSDEHIAILVSCHKGKPKRKVECPHCGTMIAIHAKNRRHFDNCAHKEN